MKVRQIWITRVFDTTIYSLDNTALITTVSLSRVLIFFSSSSKAQLQS